VRKPGQVAQYRRSLLGTSSFFRPAFRPYTSAMGIEA
jgi:hypothetical protein